MEKELNKLLIDKTVGNRIKEYRKTLRVYSRKTSRRNRCEYKFSNYVGKWKEWDEFNDND